MGQAARFECVSSSLSLGTLSRKARGVLWVCLGLGVAIHLSFTAIRSLEAEEKVSKPLTTQFVKRQPRLTKPLELKKRPQPKRRQVEREMLAVRARMERHDRATGFEPRQVLGGVARPRVEIGRIAGLASVQAEPESFSGVIEGAKEVEQRIDMSLELLDMEALDTGQYHAMVVQDLDDKRGLKGFCHLAIAEMPLEAFKSPYTFDYYVLPGFLRLADRMNEYTDVKTDVLGRITLNDAELFKAPWVFLSAHLPFRLSNSELQNLGMYMMAGGFVFADGFGSWAAVPWPGGLTALLNTLQEALASQGVKLLLEKLPNSHPIYHCYFDFDGAPMGGDAVLKHEHPDLSVLVPYLEGMQADGRLVALFSRKNFAHNWTFLGPDSYVPIGYGSWDPGPSLRFGVNTIIFALTQEGSITHRLMESVR